MDLAAQTRCMQPPYPSQLLWGSAEKETKQAFNTCPLAMGQAGQAASIQQLAGLESFARVLSNPRDSPGLSKASWKGRTWARRKDAPLAAAPGVWGRKSERWAQPRCNAAPLQGNRGRYFPGYSGNEKQEVPLIHSSKGLLDFFPFSFSFLHQVITSPTKLVEVAPHLLAVQCSIRAFLGTTTLCHQKFMCSETFSGHRARLQAQS